MGAANNTGAREEGHMKARMSSAAIAALTAATLGTVALAHPLEAQAAKRKSNTQVRLPGDSYLGDIDGDGREDIIVVRGKWAHVARTNFEGSGLISGRLDVLNIARVVTGNFRHTPAVSTRREEICSIATDNYMKCWTMGVSTRDLSYVSGQPSPFAADEQAIVGDFDGDGRDDLLAYRPTTGALRMYTFNLTTNRFEVMPNFALGNIEDPANCGFGRLNMQIRAGEFAGAAGRDDLVFVSPGGAVCMFGAVTNAAGVRTFWWAFRTGPGIVSFASEDVAIASIDGDVFDDLVIRNRTTGTYKFRRLALVAGTLPVIATDVGQLPTTPSSQMFWARTRNGWDATSNRDDSLVYRADLARWISTDARWDSVNARNTYWWAFSQRPLVLDEDQDGDGIKTVHELGGFDENGDGFSDEPLPVYGASAFVKDVFVEADFMAAAPGETVNLRLRDAAINRVVTDMARFNINLHVLPGNEVPFQAVLGGALNFDWVRDFDPIKAANFTPSRRRFFHYCLSAEAYRLGGRTGSSGISRGIPGTDFLVTLGSWANNGTNDQQAGTLLHELGHNLGLFHGGSAAEAGVNYKKNFLSVMNYDYQMSGVRKNGVMQMNYSEIVTEPLNETALNEPRGVYIVSGGPGTFATFYNSTWNNLGRGSSLVAIDWDRDGVIDAAPVAMDLNSDGGRATHLGSRNEYADIRYTFAGSPIGSAAGAEVDDAEAGLLSPEETSPEARSRPPMKKALIVARVDLPATHANPMHDPELTEEEYVRRIRPANANLPDFDYARYIRSVPEHQPLLIVPEQPAN
jgi:hypothetical protein